MKKLGVVEIGRLAWIDTKVMSVSGKLLHQIYSIYN